MFGGVYQGEPLFKTMGNYATSYRPSTATVQALAELV